MNEQRRDFLRLGALGLAGLAASVARDAAAHGPAHHPHSHSRDARFGLSVEAPWGGELPSYAHGGARYVAGELGERYALRVHNYSNRRIEAVVTVDGRDVLTGALGNFARHRGYVVPAYGSVSIEGFRQSLDHVAAFRFSRVEDSYSGRRGTPANVGVIGMAVFEERKPPSRRTRRPVQNKPRRPYYSDKSTTADAANGYAESAPAPRAENAPAAQSRSGKPRERRPAYEGDAGYSAPPPRERLGTEYGETRHSHVREVNFRRRNRNRPDALLTLYYDSPAGLRARGVVVDPVPYTPYDPYVEPEPFPDRRFAPRPPRRY